MTDTRKEFEKWFKKETPTFRENEFTAPIKNKFKKAWQACQQLNDKRIADLAKLIKEWWESHKYDTYPDGEGGEYNTFDNEPEFVSKAKEIIGDWDNT